MAVRRSLVIGFGTAVVVSSGLLELSVWLSRRMYGGGLELGSSIAARAAMTWEV